MIKWKTHNRHDELDIEFITNEFPTKKNKKFIDTTTTT
jgi:hypothetical protein